MNLISLVLPFYNEESNVRPLFDRVESVLSQIECEFELLCINDGSTDGTMKALESVRLSHARRVLIEFTRNFGKEAALTAGLDMASGQAVIFMDTDLQHPPEILPQMIERWRSGAPIVLARRRTRETDDSVYAFLAESFYRLHNRISDIAIPPDIGDFRLIDRQVAENLKRLPESRRFMKGLFSWVGYEAQIVDYDVEPRVFGKTSFNKWRSWNLALEGITSFSTVPLRLWTYVGMLLTGVGFFYAAWVIGRALLLGVEVPGYVTLLSAVIFFGGLQLIGIGILGEYVGRIYMEAKRRPSYLVRRILR